MNAFFFTFTDIFLLSPWISSWVVGYVRNLRALLLIGAVTIATVSWGPRCNQAVALPKPYGGGFLCYTFGDGLKDSYDWPSSLYLSFGGSETVVKVGPHLFPRQAQGWLEG